MSRVEILFEERERNQKKIQAYLEQYEAEFTPALSSHVAIDQYAEKISANACVFWVEYAEKCIGMCAVYMNRGMSAYITSINIDLNYSGRGFGTILMEHVKEEARRKHMERIELEVSRENRNAIQYYKANGFGVCREKKEWYVMGVQL